MSDYQGNERRKDSIRNKALLDQVMNAGIDLDTVEGRNTWRKCVEIMVWLIKARETGGSMFFKAVVVVIIGLIIAIFSDGAATAFRKFMGIH